MSLEGDVRTLSKNILQCFLPSQSPDLLISFSDKGHTLQFGAWLKGEMLTVSVSLIGSICFQTGGGGGGLQRGEGGFSGLVDHIYCPYYQLTRHYQEQEQILLLFNLLSLALDS